MRANAARGNCRRGEARLGYANPPSSLAMMAPPMSEPNAQEPTMEEILASIRRIISEDEPAAEAAAEPEAAGEPEAAAEPVAAAPAFEPEPAFAAEPEPEVDDVLELTERAPEPAPASAFETLGDLDVYSSPEPVPAPRAPLAPAAPEKPLVSAPVAASSGAAFGQLAQRMAMPREGRTLEDVVREMLNPLLKAWLDEHLETIVQAKVEAEVERIARRHT
jgi:cell pole-organizing protein PopZ